MISVFKNTNEAGVKHYSRLLNVEVDWPSDSLVDVSPVASPAPGVSIDMIRKSLCRMTGGKQLAPLVSFLK